MQLLLISTDIADITMQAKCAAHPICKGFTYILAYNACFYQKSVKYVRACTIASSAVFIYRIHCCRERPVTYDGWDCWIYNPSESTILLLLVMGGVPRLQLIFHHRDYT